LIVEDFGEGIAPEHLEKITDPFYRADPSRQRGTGGFGLGLYLCKSIAAAHKGELLVESVVGQGSKVTFSLNLPQA
jgi:two-component system phosphate regulon sensor histidine kinase PhoR